MRNLTDVEKIGIGALISFGVGTFFFFVPQIFTPILAYLYNSDKMILEVQNIGYRTATDVTIEASSSNKTLLQGVQPSYLKAEPVLNYTTADGTFVYYIHHMYQKDRVTFNLIGNKTLLASDTIDIVIRSNEGEGVEITSFYTELLPKIQILAFLVYALTGFLIYRVIVTIRRRKRSYDIEDYRY